MFTGIVQSIGRIAQATPVGPDVRLDIQTGTLAMDDVALGDSIAVGGVCLTVVDHRSDGFSAHVSHATLACTVGLEAGHEVNLEKALRLADRLGGHLVSGHVDGVGQVIRFEAAGDCWLLTVRAPQRIAHLIAVKGSIAVDGVSLTVNAVEHDTFSVNLIPHTLAATTLKNLGTGSRVNLEADLIARYVERIAQWQGDPDGDRAG